MKVIKNYLYNAGYQILLMFAPLITTPYVSRVLGAHAYGINTYTNGWVLVRASNTGPNITFRAEATSEQGVILLQNIYLPMIDEFKK